MTTKRKRQPPLHVVIAEYHDKYDLLRDAMTRDLFPRLDMSQTENAQLRDLADSMVNCLRMLRIQVSGYPPPEEREDADAA